MDGISTEAHGGVVQLHAVAQANAQAVAQQAKVLSALGVSAPNVQTSASYSPALYAQAAQYQVYTQSGTLASLLGSQGLSQNPSHEPAATAEDSTEVHAVEKAESTHVDTKA